MENVNFIEQIERLYNQVYIRKEEVFRLFSENTNFNINEITNYYNQIRDNDKALNAIYSELTNLVANYFLTKGDNVLLFHKWGSWGIQTNVLGKSDIDILVQNTKFDFEEIRKYYGELCNHYSFPYKVKEFSCKTRLGIHYKRIVIKIEYKDFYWDFKYLDNTQILVEQISAYENLKNIDKNNKVLFTWIKKIYIQNEEIYKMLKNIWYRMYFEWSN